MIDFKFDQAGFAWDEDDFSDVQELFFMMYTPRRETWKYLCSESPNVRFPQSTWFRNFSITDPRQKKAGRWIKATEQHIGQMVASSGVSAECTSSRNDKEELRGVVDGKFITVDAYGDYSCWNFAMIEIEIEEDNS